LITSFPPVGGGGGGGGGLSPVVHSNVTSPSFAISSSTVPFVPSSRVQARPSSPFSFESPAPGSPFGPGGPAGPGGPGWPSLFQLSDVSDGRHAPAASTARSRPVTLWRHAWMVVSLSAADASEPTAAPATSTASASSGSDRRGPRPLRICIGLLLVG
jgi:hypothetical protein